MQVNPYRVVKTVKETADTVTLMLEPVDGAKTTVFAGGQFNMLYVFGVGEVPISISGNPEKTGVLVHTTRAVGAVSKSISKMKKGAVVGVRGPFGTHWPVLESKGKDIIVVTGGIGLAPLRPVLYQLSAHRENYGKIILLYGARTPEEMLYPEEIKQWTARFDQNVFVTVDRATSAWKGNVGVVTMLMPKAVFDPANTVAMVCGPEVMMRFTIQELLKRGVRPDNIHISMERNMKCGIGLCGHCQYGAEFICKDGPVFPYTAVQSIFGKAEI